MSREGTRTLGGRCASRERAVGALLQLHGVISFLLFSAALLMKLCGLRVIGLSRGGVLRSTLVNRVAARECTGEKTNNVEEKKGYILRTSSDARDGQEEREVTFFTFWQPECEIFGLYGCGFCT